MSGDTKTEQAKGDAAAPTSRPRGLLGEVLVARPALLLADEPTSNLDQAAGQALLELFQGIHREGTTVIMSSHDPRAVSLATKTYELDSGRLKAF